MTILEVLVAVVIVGIAIAGITEITFINGYWSIQSLNKIDNIYASKQFLERINRELRQARSIDPSSASDSITFTIPTENSTDANGFPKTTTSVKYQVIEDPTNPPSVIPKQYLIQASYDSGAPLTVLRSIVGPQAIGGGTPKIFQYIDKNVTEASSQFGITDTPSTNPSTVVINLELMRKDYGSSTTSSNSLSGLRTETFLRGINGSI